MRTLRLILALCAVTLFAAAQETLNNDSVVKMVKAGLGENIIVSMIQNQPGKYSVTPDDMVKLKQQNVSDNILAAMMAKGSGGGTPPVPGPAAAAASTPPVSADIDLPPNIDVGIYYRKSGKWEEMLPEIVNWKTGGVIKHFATAGVVKGDINGHIQSSHSRTVVALPVDVLIYATEGTAFTEYQLVRLHESGDSREFRTMTGGVVHASGGAGRDMIPFDAKKVAPRTYLVNLPTTLGPGDYGFLPPGISGSSAAASTGKIYTVHIIE
ncbi:MAG TPA: hypothetical protein VKS01_00840 [Bryobacteraceae bacterium]|nr:hypothetical protein [Bryobacteraceae bacterium]